MHFDNFGMNERIDCCSLTRKYFVLPLSITNLRGISQHSVTIILIRVHVKHYVMPKCTYRGILKLR